MDDFREWLSDNLRYFMLGGAILIIVVVLFCGIRACSGSNKGNSGDEQKTTSEDQGNVPSSPISESATEQEKSLRQALQEAQIKIICLETMIDIAEKELNVSIRKKSGTKQ